MTKSNIYKLLGPLIFFIILLVDTPSGMSIEGFHLLGIIIWMAVWWISEVVPIAVTSLLPIILFPSLNILNIQNTGANYGHKYIFLFTKLNIIKIIKFIYLFIIIIITIIVIFALLDSIHCEFIALLD